MKISLKNFRNHLDLDLTLPDSGLVRINGRSGTGKSSILHAVRFALFGSGRGITTWNEKSTEVSLQGMGLDLKRTRGPNKIECNGANSAAAEIEIQRILGMNELEFSISSYVSQGQRSSLINLSPSEQLSLIHALSFGDENPEDKKERIKSFIKETEEKISKLQEERVRLEERIQGIANNIESVKSLADQSAEEEGIEEALDLKKSLLEEKKKQISVLKQRNLEIKNILESPERQAVDKARKTLENLEERLRESEQELLRPENVEKRTDWTEQEEKLQESQKELTRLTSRFKQLKTLEKNSVDIDRLELIISESLNKIHSIIAFGGVSREDELLEQDLLTLKMSSETALSALDSLKIAVSDEVKESNQEEMRNINKRIEEISAQLNEYTKKKKQEEDHNVKVRLLRENHSSLLNQKHKSEKILDTFGNLENTQSLEKELSDVRERGIALKGEIQVEELEIEALNAKIREAKKRQQAREELRRLEEERKNELSTLSQNELFLTRLEKSHKDAQRIQTLLIKASLDVIESTIAEINLRAAFWLDALLEGKVAAELKTTKKVKSKNEMVDSINLEIMYKGQILEKVHEDLSGGQYSRVMLAFQLALSDLYNSPILMLDEAARGCDLETIETMLETLRTVSKRKLVIIVEHNIPAFHFDQEVSVEEL